MPGRTSPPWRRDARPMQDPVNARHRKRQAFLLGQHLREMVLIEPDVLGRGQLNHPGRHARRDGVDRPPAAIPVRQGSGPLPLIAPAQPPNLANGDTQQAGRIRVHQRPRQQMVQYEQAALFRASQRDPVPLHGRTKSQNYSGRTKSQNYNIRGRRG